MTNSIPFNLKKNQLVCVKNQRLEENRETKKNEIFFFARREGKKRKKIAKKTKKKSTRKKLTNFIYKIQEFNFQFK